MEIFHGTNLGAAQAILAEGFRSADGLIYVSHDAGSARGQARGGNGTDGPCVLIVIDFPEDELAQYYVDDWKDMPCMDCKIPTARLNALRHTFILRRID